MWRSHSPPFHLQPPCLLGVTEDQCDDATTDRRKEDDRLVIPGQFDDADEEEEQMFSCTVPASQLPTSKSQTTAKVCTDPASSSLGSFVNKLFPQHKQEALIDGKEISKSSHHSSSSRPSDHVTSDGHSQLEDLPTRILAAASSTGRPSFSASTTKHHGCSGTQAASMPVIKSPTDCCFQPIAPRGGIEQLLSMPKPSYASRFFAQRAAGASLTSPLTHASPSPPGSVLQQSATTTLVTAAGQSSTPPMTDSKEASVAVARITNSCSKTATTKASIAPVPTLETPVRPQAVLDPTQQKSSTTMTPPSAAVVDAARAIANLSNSVIHTHAAAPSSISDFERMAHPHPAIVATYSQTSGQRDDSTPLLPSVKAPSDLEAMEHPISIESLRERDIILGRGGLAVHHQGNIWFREIIQHYRMHYCALAKYDKMQMAQNLAKWFYLCGARFLVRKQGHANADATKSSSWYYYEAGLDRATKKCSQALREGVAVVVRKTIEVSFHNNKYSSNSKDSKCNASGSSPTSSTSSSPAEQDMQENLQQQCCIAPESKGESQRAPSADDGCDASSSSGCSDKSKGDCKTRTKRSMPSEDSSSGQVNEVKWKHWRKRPRRT